MEWGWLVVFFLLWGILFIISVTKDRHKRLIYPSSSNSCRCNAKDVVRVNGVKVCEKCKGEVVQEMREGI